MPQDSFIEALLISAIAFAALVMALGIWSALH
jgi:hypothetical protein